MGAVSDGCRRGRRVRRGRLVGGGVGLLRLACPGVASCFCSSSFCCCDFPPLPKKRRAAAALSDRPARHEITRGQGDHRDDECDGSRGRHHAQRDVAARGTARRLAVDPHRPGPWPGRRPLARAADRRGAAPRARPDGGARCRAPAGRSSMPARSAPSAGARASLISATRTGVSAAANHVPWIQSCEVTAAAVADAALAITRVRKFRRRSSSRSRSIRCAWTKPSETAP